MEDEGVPGRGVEQSSPPCRGDSKFSAAEVGTLVEDEGGPGGGAEQSSSPRRR